MKCNEVVDLVKLSQWKKIQRKKTPPVAAVFPFLSLSLSVSLVPLCPINRDVLNSGGAEQVVGRGVTSSLSAL